ncbi:FAD-dependent oxidoreductase [Vibrio parahaemolyticus]|nr:FAD-dependent oxidoreductase [Vibrio parahaemolyticus]
MSLKIAIIGAGWYGCHIGSSLLQKGHEVTIFEKSASTISGASKRNQNRLHLGFHYPRDHETRIQSKTGFNWFIEHYGHLTESIENNYYAVAEKNSYIDFETYKIIMKGTGVSFSEIKNKDFDELSDLLVCDERVIRNDLAANYFNQILNSNLRLNTYVDLTNENVLSVMKQKFDYVIDCSWGTAKKIEGIDYYYEPCIYFYYKKKEHVEKFALTIMDGKHYSLYPYFDDIYTLTSVEHTPLGQFSNFNDAIKELSRFKAGFEEGKEKRAIFEQEFSKYYSGFLNDFTFDSPEYSMKTKVKSTTDFRGCLVQKNENLISVFSGKIDTLHIAELKIMEMIEGDY